MSAESKILVEHHSFEDDPRILGPRDLDDWGIGYGYSPLVEMPTDEELKKPAFIDWPKFTVPKEDCDG